MSIEPCFAFVMSLAAPSGSTAGVADRGHRMRTFDS